MFQEFKGSLISIQNILAYQILNPHNDSFPFLFYSPQSPMSYFTNDVIPRSIKSSSNLHRVSHSLSKRQYTFPQKPADQNPQPKFKPIDPNTSRPQKQSANELDSKYNVYKHGSPNFFSYSVQTHKAQNLKNQIHTLDLPFIDGVIRQLNNKTPKESGANLRDYDLYPNLLKIHQTHKFRDLLSDKQQLKDFLKWFQTSCEMIDQKQIPATKKFQEKQIIISSGFGQITLQVSKLSKTRSDILKMIWNKETQEVQQIIKHLTGKVIEMQKQHLTALSRMHEQYQEQVDALKKQNMELNKRLNNEMMSNQAYINTLRCDRKIMKKQQIAIKKLMQTNRVTIKQNLNLLDQNTKLIMSNGMFTRFGESSGGEGVRDRRKRMYLQSQNVSQQKGRESQMWQVQQVVPQINLLQGRMLMYRRLQISQKKSKTDKILTQIKNKLVTQIVQKSRLQVQRQGLKGGELQQKKASLLNYIRERLEQNPSEKVYIEEDFFHEDDHNLDTSEIERAMKAIIESKEVVMYLKNQDKIGNVPQLASVGVNTIQGDLEETEQKNQAVIDIV